jgi:hypothetical protein
MRQLPTGSRKRILQQHRSLNLWSYAGRFSHDVSSRSPKDFSLLEHVEMS